jgi:hypothetical protein
VSFIHHSRIPLGSGVTGGLVNPRSLIAVLIQIQEANSFALFSIIHNLKTKKGGK